ncbi:DUF305 domain-containing protein [Gordonia sp. NPDC058843]|uniref:DUF305 domain-containing protein n=1 Tax=Gordonia sp. NPDC058843 TaxID=3346648 RepID=UPI0036A35C57
MYAHTTSRRRVRAAAGLGFAASAVLALAGCSPDEEPATTTTGASQPVSSVSASASADHNEADVEFTSTMVGHHRQAVMMAELVEGRTDNAELIALASSIEKAQNSEITQMEERLESWGVSTDGLEDSHENMGHGGHSAMPGMLDPDQMAALRDARGTEFDALWLEGMIRHHEGAIAMADAVLADGVDPATKALAQEVKRTQQAEIDQMKGMLGRS